MHLKNHNPAPMKNNRLAFYTLVAILTLALATSCTGPKQVFYFQPGLATPKVGAKTTNPQPNYSANNTLNLADLSRPDLTATPETEPAGTSVALNKKELRKLVRKTLKNMKDTTNNQEPNRRVLVTLNKDKIGQLETGARNFKNSVRVQDNDKKITLDKKSGLTEFSQTEYILLGVAALLILLILLSLPILGPLLGVVLALAIIALGVALLTGYIDLNI